MAIFRKVHTSFWSDAFTGELDNEKKLFYLYLITNEKTTQCGVYEIRKKQIAFDLGYSIDKVSKLLQYFSDMGKIMFSEETNEIAIKNWAKYNSSTSPKVQSCINKELKLVKNTLLIQYVNGIYTETQEEQEQEQEKEEEKEEEKDTRANYKKAFLSKIVRADLDERNQYYFDIAIGFHKLFKQITLDAGGTTTTLDKAKGTWIDDIRLLMEADKADRQKLVEIWHWLPTSEFWKKNIASASKLREKYNELIKQMNYEKNRRNPKEGTTWNELAEITAKHFGVKID